MSIADNIKIFRELRKLSVPDLAKKIGVNKQSVYDWEKGEYGPSQDNLDRLAEVFEVNKADFYKENSTQVEKTPRNEQQRETVYQTIVEGHTEYVLIPRNVLDKTQLVSSEQINRTWDELTEKNRELERKNKQIDFYQEQIAKLLSSLELTTKPSDTKKVK